LTGIITDATSAAPMHGAVVEARIAADESMWIAAAVAGPDGRYSFHSVPGVTYVRVLQYGYFDVNERVELTADATRNFSIARDPSVPDLNGAYTLTIETDAACPAAPNPLPPNLRRRTFPAQMQQVRSQLTLRAGSDPNRWIAGFASNTGATFSLLGAPDSGFVEWEDLVEWIFDINGDPVQQIVFLGTATTNFTPTGLLGSLDGTMTLYPYLPSEHRRLPSTGACRAGRFELTRR
jgi:hypothetical protein